MEKIYKSHTEIGLVLLGILLLSTPIYSILKGDSSVELIVVTIIVFLLMIVGWLLARNRVYTAIKDDMVVSSYIFSKEEPFKVSEIISIDFRKNFFSSSSNLLLSVEGEAGNKITKEVLQGYADPTIKEFVEDVTKINPNIQISDELKKHLDD